MIGTGLRELLLLLHLRTDTLLLRCAQITNAHQCWVICFYYSLILYWFECSFIILDNLRFLLQTVVLVCQIFRYNGRSFIKCRRQFFRLFKYKSVNAKHQVIIVVFSRKQIHKFFELITFEQRSCLSVNNSKYKFPQLKQSPVVV